MLPHLAYVERPNGAEYIDAYAAARKKGNHVILDNGAAEDEKVDWDFILNVAEAVDAQEVVLPDTLYDSATTWKQVSDVWSYTDPKRSYMYVLHPEEIEDATAWAGRVIHRFGVTTFGIPRHLVASLRFDSRIRIAEDLAKLEEVEGVDLQVHFLGTNTYWMQEVKYASRVLGNKVRGVDTSAPYVYAYNGFYLNDEELCVREPDYFETVPTKRFANNNALQLMRWTSMYT